LRCAELQVYPNNSGDACWPSLRFSITFSKDHEESFPCNKNNSSALDIFNIKKYKFSTFMNNYEE